MECVQLLVDASADLTVGSQGHQKYGLSSSVSRHETTPLHETVLAGFGSCAQILLDAGVVVDRLDGRSRSALDRVAHGQRWKSISQEGRALTATLIAAGAHPFRAHNKLPQWVEQLCGFEQTDSAPSANGPKQRSDTENEAMEALYEAAKCGSAEAVRVLVQQPEISPNSFDESNRTALHYAAMYGSLDSVTTLLECRAFPNVIDKDGATPLSMAAFFNHAACVNALVEGRANVNIADERGRTPVYMAIKNGSHACLWALLSANARFNAVTMAGASPLHLAVKRSDEESIIALTRAGARLNPQAHGQTPLGLAIAKEDGRSARLLMEAGALLSRVSDAPKWAVQLERDVACRRIIVTLLGAVLRRHSSAAQIPRESSLLIARLVWATRNDAQWTPCVEEPVIPNTYDRLSSEEGQGQEEVDQDDEEDEEQQGEQRLLFEETSSQPRQRPVREATKRPRYGNLDDGGGDGDESDDAKMSRISQVRSSRSTRISRSSRSSKVSDHSMVNETPEVESSGVARRSSSRKKQGKKRSRVDVEAEMVPQQPQDAWQLFLASSSCTASEAAKQWREMSEFAKRPWRESAARRPGEEDDELEGFHDLLRLTTTSNNTNEGSTAPLYEDSGSGGDGAQPLLTVTNEEQMLLCTQFIGLFPGDGDLSSACVAMLEEMLLLLPNLIFVSRNDNVPTGLELCYNRQQLAAKLRDFKGDPRFSLAFPRAFEKALSQEGMVVSKPVQRRSPMQHWCFVSGEGEDDGGLSLPKRRKQHLISVIDAAREEEEEEQEQIRITLHDSTGVLPVQINESVDVSSSVMVTPQEPTATFSLYNYLESDNKNNGK